MKIGRLLAIACLLVLVVGLPILRHLNSFERQSPISVQVATADIIDPSCPAHEPLQVSDSIIPVVYAQVDCPPPPPPSCDFSLAPNGDILAKACDSVTVNKQTFSATIVPSLSECPIVPSTSSCSFTTSGDVYYDAAESEDDITTTAASCIAAYEAYSEGGSDAGSYQFSMTLQWYNTSKSTTHAVSGHVQCP
jgi:hypothetical protein